MPSPSQVNIGVTPRYRVLHCVLASYLGGTIFLYFFGPIPWIVVAPTSLVMIAICYLAFTWAARPSGVRPPSDIRFRLGSWRGPHDQSNRWYVATLALSAIAIVSVKNFVLFGSLLPHYSVLQTSYYMLKQREGALVYLSYVNFAIAPVLLYCISGLLIANWRSPALKVVCFSALSFFVYSTVITGSGSSVIEIVLLFGLVYLRSPNWNRGTIVKIIIVVIVVAVGLATLLRPRLDTLESMSIPIIPVEKIGYEFNVSNASTEEFAANIITFYLTQGYQGFQFAENHMSGGDFLPFMSSVFVERQYERLNLLPLTYQRLDQIIDEEDGWTSGLLWSTSFLSFREDVPLFAMPFLTILFGIYFRAVAFSYLAWPTAFRLAQAMLMVKIVLFLPLNAIFLATGEELARTLVFLVLPLVAVTAATSSRTRLPSRGASAMRELPS